MLQGGTDSLAQVEELLNGISNIEFLKQLTGNLLLKITASQPSQSTLELTNWLIQLDRETDLALLREMLLAKLKDIIQAGLTSVQYSSMTQQIFDYVNKNLQDSNLSLKGIAENHLFMNVDYVSKKILQGNRQKVFPLPDGNEDSACKGPDESQSFCIDPDHCHADWMRK